jgi:hypothetical protein
MPPALAATAQVVSATCAPADPCPAGPACWQRHVDRLLVQFGTISEDPTARARRPLRTSSWSVSRPESASPARDDPRAVSGRPSAGSPDRTPTQGRTVDARTPSDEAVVAALCEALAPFSWRRFTPELMAQFALAARDRRELEALLSALPGASVGGWERLEPTSRGTLGWPGPPGFSPTSAGPGPAWSRRAGPSRVSWVRRPELGAYCRAIAMRTSLSVSVMRSPDTSMTTSRRVPVNRNGEV